MTTAIQLKFVLGSENAFANTKGMEIAFKEGELSIKLYYDFSEKPLVLTGCATPGDSVTLLLLDYRIELWINGNLIDEEWPAGNCLYEQSFCFEGNLDLKVSMENYTEQANLPSVLGTFENAEGWKPEENIFVGDCMPYYDGGRYHVLYLKDRRHHGSKWRFGAHQWEHISTSDFEKWEIHPTAVKITDPIEGSICTGSWIKKDDIHYLYYTVRMSDKSPAPICRSISKDGYNFTKDTDFAFTLSDKYNATRARDPKIILDSNGLYHMILTTALVKENKGCLAHLISKDLESWEETETPIYISEDETHPECPDYVKLGEYYYLIFSLKGTGLYLYSKEPFSNWQTPENPVIPCKTVPKSAIWKDKIVFAGFNKIEDYAGTLTFKTATNDQNGQLIFE